MDLLYSKNKRIKGRGKEGETKAVVGDREAKQVVCEELCVTKWYMKDGVRQRMVYVTKFCVKDRVCVKVVCVCV